jgi:hypothetical protein
MARIKNPKNNSALKGTNPAAIKVAALSRNRATTDFSVE